MTAFSSRAEAIRSRCEAATPGPWQRAGVRYQVMDEDCIVVGPDSAGWLIALPVGFRGTLQTEAINDADFIAHARTDLPDALAEIARLTAQVETLQVERDKLQLALTTQTMCGLIQCPYMKRADAAEAQVTALLAERDQLRADNIQYAAEWKDCEPYLKDDGEQPAECLARNRKDIDALVTLLAQEKAQVERLQRERLEATTEVGRLLDVNTALGQQVETLQGERDFGRAGSIPSYFDRMKEIAKRYDDLAEAVWPENEREVFGYGDCIVRAVKAREAMKLLGTATTLAATHFDRANAAEAQVETLQGERDKVTKQRDANFASCDRLSEDCTKWHRIADAEQADRLCAAKRAVAAEAQVTQLQAQAAAQNKETVRAWECQAADRKSALANYAKFQEAEAQVTALRALLRACMVNFMPSASGALVSAHPDLWEQIRAALEENKS